MGTRLSVASPPASLPVVAANKRPNLEESHNNEQKSAMETPARHEAAPGPFLGCSPTPAMMRAPLPTEISILPADALDQPRLGTSDEKDWPTVFEPEYLFCTRKQKNQWGRMATVVGLVNFLNLGYLKWEANMWKYKFSVVERQLICEIHRHDNNLVTKFKKWTGDWTGKFENDTLKIKLVVKKIFAPDRRNENAKRPQHRVRLKLDKYERGWFDRGCDRWFYYNDFRNRTWNTETMTEEMQPRLKLETGKAFMDFLKVVMYKVSVGDIDTE